MKRLAIFVFLAAVLMMISACGGGSSVASNANEAQNPSAGNWLLIATSNTIVTTGSGSGRNYTFLRGPLAASGNTLSATMAVSSQLLLCYQEASPNVFSGSVDNSVITLTSASVGGSVLTITAPLNSATSLDGTYSSSQGTFCTSADSGTVYGTFVPSIAGNWSGTLNSSKYGPIGVSASIQQGTATSQGLFTLSGTVALQNYPCFTSGAISSSNSYIQGEDIFILATASDGTTIKFNSASLSNPAIATEIVYNGTTVTGGVCGGDFIFSAKSILTQS